MSAAVENLVRIVSPGDTRYFTLADANETLPLIQRITADSSQKLQIVRCELRNLLPNDPRVAGVEVRYEKIVKKWISKMERLGVIAKGLWLVDFDTGDGYLCWKYPELKVSHYHEYTGGFATRQPIKDIIEQNSPNWA